MEPSVETVVPSPGPFAVLVPELERLVKRELQQPLGGLVQATQLAFADGKGEREAKRSELIEGIRELQKQIRELEQDEERHVQTSRRSFLDARRTLVQQLGQHLREETAALYVDEELKAIVPETLARALLISDDLQAEIPRPSIEPPDFAAAAEGGVEKGEEGKVESKAPKRRAEHDDDSDDEPLVASKRARRSRNTSPCVAGFSLPSTTPPAEPRGFGEIKGNGLKRSISMEEVTRMGDYIIQWRGAWVVVVCDVHGCTYKHFRDDPLAEGRIMRHFSSPFHRLGGMGLDDIVTRFGLRVDGATEEWVDETNGALRKHQERQRRMKQVKLCFVAPKRSLAGKDLGPANRAPVADMGG